MNATDTSETTGAATAAPANTDPSVNMVVNKFHFKTEKLRDDKGNVIGEGKKHPSVDLSLPIPTVSTLAKFLANPTQYAKEVELLLSTVTDQIYRIARMQINDFREANKDGTVTAAVLNYDKLSWTSIANMPKSERASSIPSDEEFTAFYESYMQTMPAALGKPPKNIENHILCFKDTFKKQRSQKDILDMFKNALTVYTAVAGEAAVEEHEDVITYYTNKLDKMLNASEKITMDDL